MRSWNVIYDDINARKIREYNIFKHSGFTHDLDELQSLKLSNKDFSNELDRICRYYFWSKCEYEIIVSEWPPCSNREPIEEKIDIYYQLKLNWDIFVNYCYKGE